MIPQTLVVHHASSLGMIDQQDSVSEFMGTIESILFMNPVFWSSDESQFSLRSWHLTVPTSNVIDND